MDLKSKGFRAVMLFVVQREDVASFSPATSLDPKYSQLLKEAHSRGVEILVYQCRMGVQELGPGNSLPFDQG